MIDYYKLGGQCAVIDIIFQAAHEYQQIKRCFYQQVPDASAAEWQAFWKGYKNKLKELGWAQ